MKIFLKQADERILSIWMFIAWVVIGAAIVLGVALFNSQQTDVRQYEASIIGDSISNCIINQADLSEKFRLSVCNLNQDQLINSGNYYVSVSVKDSKLDRSIVSISAGPSSWQIQCDYQLKQEKIEKNFAQCYYNSFNYFSDSGEIYEVNILVGVNK